MMDISIITTNSILTVSIPQSLKCGGKNMLANKTITTLYNPGEKDREVLKAEFVIRLKEFNNIFNDIKTSKMEKPEQHYLLIGQRGSGKSTLIQRLRYAIEDDAELSQWLIPIAFTEEQYN